MTNQLSLDLNGAPLAQFPLNPTAPKERLRALQRKCWAVLERLLEGPASNVELHRLIGGTRNAAPRVNDLRPWLRRMAGLGAHDKVADPIPCTNNRETGLAQYQLAPWAVEAARLLFSRRPKCGLPKQSEAV